MPPVPEFPPSLRRTPAAMAVHLALALAASTPAARAQSQPDAPRTEAAVQTVEVNGTRAPAARAPAPKLGLLGAADPLDTPFSVSSTGEEALRHRHAATAAEAVATDPSVRLSAAPGGLFDTLYIRGFPISEGNLGEFGFDGVYGIAPNYRVMTDYAERIELIKGPTALLNGVAPNGGIGGSINLVPKRAGAADLTRVGLETASQSLWGARIDVGRRFGADRALGVRVNASLRDGDTALDHQSRRARVGALALDWRSAGLRASLDLVGQQERLQALSRPFFLAAGLASVPAAPPARRNVTQAWEWSEVDDRAALLRAEADVGERVTVFAHAGASRNEVDRLFGNPTLTNAAGDVRTQPQRFHFDIRRATAEAGVRARIDTGGIEHALALQAAQYRDRLARASANGQPLLSNLYLPVEHAAQAVAAPAVVPKLSQTTLSSVALVDTLSFADQRVLLTLGARAQRIETENFNAATGVLAPPRYDRRATTPMLGLVLKARPDLSLYGNFIEGLGRGDTIPATASNAADGVLAPTRARQIEMGLKLERRGTQASAGLFQISKPSGQFADGPTSAYSADAEQRHRGLELALAAAPAAAWRVQAGLTLLDAQVTKSSTAARLGKTPVGVPRRQATLATEWDAPVPAGFTLSLAASYASQQFVDALNTQRLPSWTRFDAGARWVTTLAGRPATWRLTVQNLFDRDHWAGVASYGGIAQALPRTLALSASFDL